MRWLEVWLEEEHPPQVLRRVRTILYYVLRFDGLDIAKALGAHSHLIDADQQAFARKGPACLHPLPVGGAPARITA